MNDFLNMLRNKKLININEGQATLERNSSELAEFLHEVFTFVFVATKILSSFQDSVENKKKGESSRVCM